MPPATASPPNIGDLHDAQLVALLRSGAHAALLTGYFGDAAYRELHRLAELAALRRNRRGPLVYLLPGIMGSRLGGSHLGTDDPASAGLIWLHPAAIAAGALLQLALPGTRPLHAVGIMLPGYLKLQLSLEIAGFTPVFHPFDWRCDLDLLGRAFMREIERSGAERVYVVAHSMGGLVARAALAHDKKNRIAKLLQLGAPNLGSYAPVQALRAVYPTVRKIAALDQQHSAEQLARRVFRTLPGLYQLLPAAANDLFDAQAWPDDELRPDTTLLAQARERRAALPEADERCFVIAGTQQETVTAATLRDSTFEYTIRRDGDGTVPVALARWPGARTWYVEENHGMLTNNDLVLAAIEDILQSADTSRLHSNAPPPDRNIVRTVSEHALRTEALQKIRWDSLSPDSRRRILDPVISPEFRTASGHEPG